MVINFLFFVFAFSLAIFGISLGFRRNKNGEDYKQNQEIVKRFLNKQVNKDGWPSQIYSE